MFNQQSLLLDNQYFTTKYEIEKANTLLCLILKKKKNLFYIMKVFCDPEPSKLGVEITRSTS